MKQIFLFLIFFLSFSCQNSPKINQIPTIGFLDAFEDETIAQARIGYFDALQSRGFSENDKTLKVIYRNAQGDLPTLVQALDYLIAQKVTVIAANPTTSTITAVQKTKTIPVCMMVCSHPNLLGLTDKQGNYPKNLFGIYDNLEYIATSVKMIQELRPNTKKLGVIYSEAQPQSVNAYNTIKAQCQKMNMELVAYPVNSSSDTQLTTQALVGKGIDAFFAMPDNVIFSSFEVVYKVCAQAKIPIFTSEEGLVKRGSVAAYGADMYRWGYDAGLQTADYLKDTSKDLPKIAQVSLHKKLFNSEIAKNYQIQSNDSFTDIHQKLKGQNQNGQQVFSNFYLAALMLGLAFSALAMGIFISMRIFDIPDITTDGSYTLGATVSAVLLLQGLPLPLVLLAAMLAGGLAGICTGFIHTSLKVNALLAGILVMTALYSVNLTLMGKSNIPLLETANILNILVFLQNDFLSQLVMLSVFTLLIAILISYLLRTDFGLAMRATGNSETMIRANGINTNWMKMIGLAISNALVALSGFLIVQYQGFADINMGIGIVIIGLGSVMIGETLTQTLGWQKIEHRVLGVIFGAILFRMILAITLALGVNPNLLKLITALFVLLVVALPNLKISKKRN